MSKGKALAAIAAASIVIICPGYRYWVVGSLIAHKILADKVPYRKVPKGSKQYKRLVNGI